MFGLSIGEILVLAVIALIVIGPKQLPEFARQIGRLINEIKRSTGNFAEEIKQQAKVDLELQGSNFIKPEPPPVPTQPTSSAAETAASTPDNKDTPS